MNLSKKDSEILKQVFERISEEELSKLPTDEELEYITFSPRFENKMQRLIQRQKKFYYSMINTVGKRIACIVLVIVISLTTTLSVEALRKPFVKFITETYEKFTSIIFDEEENIQENFEFEKIKPAYIPEGFTLEAERLNIISYELFYKNADGRYFTYYQEPNIKTTVGANTENTTYEIIQFNNFEGIIYENKNENTLIVSDGEYVFTIYGTIPQDEAIKIAESIKN